MKKLIGLSLFLSVVACGKAGKIIEVPVANSNSNSVTAPQIKEVTKVKAYAGKSFFISNEGQARITVVGNEAEAIYSALQVREIAWSETTSAKTGTYIYCLKNTAKEKTSYKCDTYINLTNGFLSENKNVQEDNSVQELEKKFDGQNIEISPKQKQLTISLSGTDALKLYEAWDYAAVDEDQGDLQISTKGASPFLMCQRKAKEDAYSFKCNFTLTFQNGKFGSKVEPIPHEENVNKTTEVIKEEVKEETQKALGPEVTPLPVEINPPKP